MIKVSLVDTRPVKGMCKCRAGDPGEEAAAGKAPGGAIVDACLLVVHVAPVTYLAVLGLILEGAKDPNKVGPIKGTRHYLK